MAWHRYLPSGWTACRSGSAIPGREVTNWYRGRGRWARGGEGQVCDFTLLRVYTWGAIRKRYETAYVESHLCGRLPIQVSWATASPEFHFAEAGGSTAQRTYILQQTIVRRLKDEFSPGH